MDWVTAEALPADVDHAALAVAALMCVVVRKADPPAIRGLPFAYLAIPLKLFFLFDLALCIFGVSCWISGAMFHHGRLGLGIRWPPRLPGLERLLGIETVQTSNGLDSRSHLVCKQIPILHR